MQNDTIDLRKVWQIIIKRKQIIIGLTILITIVAVIYVIAAKPVYKGSAMLEVGQIVHGEINGQKNSSSKIERLDNLNTLKTLVSKEIDVSTIIPKKTNLLSISVVATDKTIIEKKLKKAVAYVLDRGSVRNSVSV